MDIRELLKGNPLPWLLEPDPAQPGIRYFALKDLLGRGEEEREVQEALRAIMFTGPVPAILAAQEPQGFWVKPGPGYDPKYTGTVCQVTFLGQLGADAADRRVRAGCDYILTHAIASHGGFSATGAPSGFIHCLGGNLAAALIDLGQVGDQRLQRALEWQARAIVGERIAGADCKDTKERYYKSGTCGPLFACAANAGLACAWGAVKAMRALSKVPPKLLTPVMRSAIAMGVGFLLGRDLALTDYPSGYSSKPSSSWFRFGYPIGYVTDVLENLEVLAVLGYAKDQRLAGALNLVLGKQDDRGRWRLEYTYNGKTWADVEEKGKPSKWVTLRALRVLRAAYQA